MADQSSTSTPRKFGRPPGSKVVGGKVYSPSEIPSPRGRPPGSKVVGGKVTTLSEAPKRGRGRPKKSSLGFEVEVNENADSGAELGDDEDSMAVQETETDAMVIDSGNSGPTEATKRPRGRPRKNTGAQLPSLQVVISPQLLVESENNNQPQPNEATEQVKRPRGRPRKHPLPIDSPDSFMAPSTPSVTPGRGRGRPPKKGIARKVSKTQRTSASPINRSKERKGQIVRELSAFVEEFIDNNLGDEEDITMGEAAAEQQQHSATPSNTFTPVQNSNGDAAAQLRREMEMEAEKDDDNDDDGDLDAHPQIHRLKSASPAASASSATRLVAAPVAPMGTGIAVRKRTGGLSVPNATKPGAEALAQSDTASISSAQSIAKPALGMRDASTSTDTDGVQADDEGTGGE